MRIVHPRPALLGVLLFSACGSGHGAPSMDQLQGSARARDASGSDVPDAQALPLDASRPELDAASAAPGVAVGVDAGGSMTTETLPAQTKGYELYAWESAGELRYALLTGTNRPKTLAEITGEDQKTIDGAWVAFSGKGLPALDALLKRVPAGTPILLTERADVGTLSPAARAEVERLLPSP